MWDALQLGQLDSLNLVAINASKPHSSGSMAAAGPVTLLSFRELDSPPMQAPTQDSQPKEVSQAAGCVSTASKGPQGSPQVSSATAQVSIGS